MLETSVDITKILKSAKLGDQDARASLVQAAYEELRRLAGVQMRKERQDHTLTATALVNEVSLRMLNEADVPIDNRNQFFGYAARAMRNLLIDHARTKGRQKRGGNQKKVEFQEAVVACQEQRDDLLALNDALESLSEL